MAEAWLRPLTESITEIKEEYSYTSTPLCVSMACSGVNVIFTLHFTLLPTQSSHRQSEKWCIKNMLQTSTAYLFLYMLSVKTNNIDP